jgi:hypothetical protein
MKALFQPRGSKDPDNIIGRVKAQFTTKAIGQNQDGSTKYAIETPGGDFSFGNILIELDGEKYSVLAQSFDKRVANDPATSDQYGLTVVKKPAIPEVVWETAS